MQNNYSKEVTYAGFWVRFFAYLIDSVIVFVALLAVRLLLAGVTSLIEGTPLGGNILFQYTLKDIVLYGAQVVYFLLFTYTTGTTPGKRLMNLRVVSADGQKLTLLNVLYREVIGRFLCGIFLNIGYIVAGIDKQKRGIHDMLSDTRVIYEKKVKVYPVYQAQAVPPVPRQVTPPPHTSGGTQTPPQNMPGTPVPPHTSGGMQTPPPHTSGGMQTPPPYTPAGTQMPPQNTNGTYRMVRPEERKPEAMQPQTEKESQERDS